jgi:hypothetical protein
LGMVTLSTFSITRCLGDFGKMVNCKSPTPSTFYDNLTKPLTIIIRIFAIKESLHETPNNIISLFSFP